jgi:hypothetical protein
MAPGRRGFLRDNAFLLAAVSLPLLVVVFFLLASIIPRWFVPPPAHDLLLRANDSYNQGNPRLTVDFNVRNGRVEATVRALPDSMYGVRSALFLFDHRTTATREIPIDLPVNLVADDPPRTIVVEALAGRQVVAEPQAPDGYRFETRSERGPGIVGDLFGMNRYDSGASLVKQGRVIAITLPPPYQNRYLSGVYAVGWLADDPQH